MPDELNRRKAVMVVHPTEGPSNDILVQGYPAPASGHPAESTRIVVSLIDGGTVARCPISGSSSRMAAARRRRSSRGWLCRCSGSARKTPRRMRRGSTPAIDSPYFDTAIVNYPASLGLLPRPAAALVA